MIGRAAAKPVRVDLRRMLLAYVALALLSLVAVYAGTQIGKGRPPDATLVATFLQLRLMRTLVGFGVGAVLAVAGVVVQGLFRNDLASPSVLGTSAAAAVGGQAALIAFQMVFASVAPFGLRPDMFVPLGCVVGALMGLAILLLVNRVTGDLLVVLLSGFLVSSLFISVGAFLTSLTRDSWELGRALTAFTLGDLAGSGSHQLGLVLSMGSIAIGFAWYWGRTLDLLLSGEEEARSLGVLVEQVKLWSIIWTAVLTAAAVSVAGNVGFVGLVVPHALRPWVGPLHRRLIPAAALGGGCFVVLCDILCRLAPTQSELPLGVVTGLFGAPVFFALLLRGRR